MTTREEKEVLETLRAIEHQLRIAVALLEELVMLNRTPTYQAPVGFGFVAQ